MINEVEGIMKNERGKVEIRGKRIKRIKRKEGYILKKDEMMKWKKVMENVEIGIEIEGKKKEKESE